MTGFQGEVRIATDAANRGETMLRWRDPVGSHGANMISVTFCVNNQFCIGVNSVHGLRYVRSHVQFPRIGRSQPATCAGYLLNGADPAALNDGGRNLHSSCVSMAVANGVPQGDPALALCR